MGDHDLEIPLPGGTPSWPPNPRTERIKMWANIIATVAAITIAIAAAIKPADGGSAEAAYQEMTHQLKQLHEENVRQHEDIVTLRKYLDDYLRSSTIVGPHDRGDAEPRSPNAPVIMIPIDKSKIRVWPGPNTQPVLILPAGQAPPLPDVNPAPEPLKIPDFKDVVANTPKPVPSK